MKNNQHKMRPFYGSLALTGWDKPTENNDGISLTFPSGTNFQLNLNSTKWDNALKLNLSTDRLWAFSLKYIWWLFTNGSKESAINAIHDYYSLPSGKKKLYEASIPGSWDHSVALRLRLLSCMLEDLDEEDLNRFIEYMKIEILWAEMPGNIKKNNHGFMLVTSILVSSVALSPSCPGRAVELRVFAIQKLEQILESVFGNDFYCNENSPFYAHFYIYEMKRIREQFINNIELPKLTELLNLYISNSQNTLEKVLHPSGSIPPMGDSSFMDTKYRSELGTHYSVRTGFWVHKRKDLYFSFKCGFDSIVHKHVDDTSITLQYKGTDFIIDSGFANYNYSDPRVISLRTQKAHSGVYFTELDDEYPSRVYKKPYFARAGMKVDAPSSVTGWSVLNGDSFISRLIEMEGTTKIIISDSFFSRIYKTPIQRFIVPSEVKLSVDNNSILLSKDKDSVLLDFDNKVSITQYATNKGKGAKGWMSTKPNELVPVNCVEISSFDPHVIPKITITLL